MMEFSLEDIEREKFNYNHTDRNPFIAETL